MAPRAATGSRFAPSATRWLARTAGSCRALRNDAIDLDQQFPPCLLDLGRPVGSENFADRIRDHLEKFAEQFSRRATGVMRLHFATDHAKAPRSGRRQNPGWRRWSAPALSPLPARFLL